jgi:hypothetical protein
VVAVRRASLFLLQVVLLVQLLSCTQRSYEPPSELGALLRGVGATFTMDSSPETYKSHVASADSSRDEAIGLALRGTNEPPRGGLTAVYGSLGFRGALHAVWLVIANSVRRTDGSFVTIYSFVDPTMHREILGWNAVGTTYERRGE